MKNLKLVKDAMNLLKKPVGETSVQGKLVELGFDIASTIVVVLIEHTTRKMLEEKQVKNEELASN